MKGQRTTSISFLLIMFASLCLAPEREALASEPSESPTTTPPSSSTTGHPKEVTPDSDTPLADTREVAQLDNEEITQKASELKTALGLSDDLLKEGNEAQLAEKLTGEGGDQRVAKLLELLEAEGNDNSKPLRTALQVASLSDTDLAKKLADPKTDESVRTAAQNALKSRFSSLLGPELGGSLFVAKAGPHLATLRAALKSGDAKIKDNLTTLLSPKSTAEQVAAAKKALAPSLVNGELPFNQKGEFLQAVRDVSKWATYPSADEKGSPAQLATGTSRRFEPKELQAAALEHARGVDGSKKYHRFFDGTLAPTEPGGLGKSPQPSYAFQDLGKGERFVVKDGAAYDAILQASKGKASWSDEQVQAFRKSGLTLVSPGKDGGPTQAQPLLGVTRAGSGNQFVFLKSGTPATKIEKPGTLPVEVATAFGISDQKTLAAYKVESTVWARGTGLQGAVIQGESVTAYQTENSLIVANERGPNRTGSFTRFSMDPTTPPTEGDVSQRLSAAALRESAPPPALPPSNNFAAWEETYSSRSMTVIPPVTSTPSVCTGPECGVDSLALEPARTIHYDGDPIPGTSRYVAAEILKGQQTGDSKPVVVSVGKPGCKNCDLFKQANGDQYNIHSLSVDTARSIPGFSQPGNTFPFVFLADVDASGKLTLSPTGVHGGGATIRVTLPPRQKKR